MPPVIAGPAATATWVGGAPPPSQLGHARVPSAYEGAASDEGAASARRSPASGAPRARVCQLGQLVRPVPRTAVRRRRSELGRVLAEKSGPRGVGARST
jgi:hypothetical protein